MTPSFAAIARIAGVTEPVVQACFDGRPVQPRLHERVRYVCAAMGWPSPPPRGCAAVLPAEPFPGPAGATTDFGGGPPLPPPESRVEPLPRRHDAGGCSAPTATPRHHRRKA